MNLVFLLQDVPRLYGAERATLDLALALARRLPVRLWLIGEQRLGDSPGALHAAAIERGLSVDRFPVAGRFSWSLVRRLRARLSALEKPILHTVGYKAHLHALIASRGLAPTVTTIHGWLVRPELKERFYEWLEVRALRHDDAVICLSSYYQQQLRRVGVRPNRLHLIPTGLDPARLPDLTKAEGWLAGPFTFALIGRLSSEKNHAMLLRAAVRLRGAGWSFRALLVGEGPERATIEARIRALELTEVVECVGYADTNELLPRLHAVVLCSRIENLPMSVLEAMAWARPVVATAVGGLPDLVRDGETGWLAPDDDDAALADRLARLMRDPQRARAMGAAGRRRLEAQFLLDRCVQRHLELYPTLRA